MEPLTDEVRPPVLYKYQAFNQLALSNLATRRIWCSRPLAYNDPFDCAIRVDSATLSDDEYDRLYVHLRPSRGNPLKFDETFAPLGSKHTAFRRQTRDGLDSAFEEQKRTMLNERGVCCFSECCDEILMWSHYADSHRGFCLGFDAGADPFCKTWQVNYVKDIPSLNPTSVVLHGATDVHRAMTTTKSDRWSYEREWRFFHKKGHVSYGYDVGALQSVHFGAAASDADMLVVSKILDGTGARYFKMRLERSRFALHAEPMEFHPLP